MTACDPEQEFSVNAPFSPEAKLSRLLVDETCELGLQLKMINEVAANKTRFLFVMDILLLRSGIIMESEQGRCLSTISFNLPKTMTISGCFALLKFSKNSN